MRELFYRRIPDPLDSNIVQFPVYVISFILQTSTKGTGNKS